MPAERFTCVTCSRLFEPDHDPGSRPLCVVCSREYPKQDISAAYSFPSLGHMKDALANRSNSPGARSAQYLKTKQQFYGQELWL